MKWWLWYATIAVAFTFTAVGMVAGRLGSWPLVIATGVLACVFCGLLAWVRSL